MIIAASEIGRKYGFDAAEEAANQLANLGSEQTY